MDLPPVVSLSEWLNRERVVKVGGFDIRLRVPDDPLAFTRLRKDLQEAMGEQSDPPTPEQQLRAGEANLAFNREMVKACLVDELPDRDVVLLIHESGGVVGDLFRTVMELTGMLLPKVSEAEEEDTLPLSGSR